MLPHVGKAPSSPLQPSRPSKASLSQNTRARTVMSQAFFTGSWPELGGPSTRSREREEDKERDEHGCKEQCPIVIRKPIANQGLDSAKPILDYHIGQSLMSRTLHWVKSCGAKILISGCSSPAEISSKAHPMPSRGEAYCSSSTSGQQAKAAGNTSSVDKKGKRYSVPYLPYLMATDRWAGT
ncbi:uncharacterized protein LY79DRAFT_536577 [Colletotrichum navitas]|uniref:Uncharacterized protein n=1 Tax=Colletotrichum navitas TaxID=681940 RepID=A0AAD8QAM3_9PEZI|nr:uncharacterized protein LY79DRAFT_536577 [Colletotrichum navitas]KAK1599002.1 hypothetical protein LY79DRAFT_536577 [Colletotrichum navitas]